MTNEAGSNRYFVVKPAFHTGALNVSYLCNSLRSGAAMHYAQAACVLERLIEFERTAVMLEMPMDECLGILNIPHGVYSALRSRNFEAEQLVTPELERRLSYALPLMRRLATSGGQARAATPATLVAV